MGFLFLMFGLLLSCSKNDRVLVFSKTVGFRHESIETGAQAIKQLGKENKFEVVHTEDSKIFSPDTLKDFDLVIFLNTTGDVLNSEQEICLKNFINKGGAFMGIHSAADTEYDWPWYGDLVGAYFLNHPEQSEAKIRVVEPSHQACQHLSKEWVRFDEWYNYKRIKNDIQVIMELDESSYIGGENGTHHPIAWYQEFDGGRSFYTGCGHTKETYLEKEFLGHLLGGIQYCLKK
ncbi:ThuA domain-containing protein [Mangrovimonas futianensis]|uniref:ThuA domain-containing protein n=2 Tax=Mangrovimonas futianensis TaxID=2895523 RepID=UPI001E5DD904|nr:ThuA domain-containing protein [Mangrovimonas futianensis]MCF1194005.1 ThuA domain-containing protein [Mangrovimonas futianensis]